MRAFTSGRDTEFDVKKMYSLEGKVAVVTGGSGDLGRAFALGLAQLGSEIVLLGRNGSKLEKARRDVEKTAVDVTTQTVNVLSPKKMKQAADRIYSDYGKLDVLVNSHGINLRVPTEKYSIKAWENVVDTNLKGTFLSCQTFGAYMIKQRSGKIVNISSTAGSYGYKWGYSAYSSSKGGVDALTRTLAVEWAKYGININTVAPYFLHTELTAKFLKNPKTHAELVRDVPLGRLGYPRDAVGAVLFFSTAASDWITGQTVYVDGGYSAH
jgi:NAD(P)-dependent dehydrogenase (short-subunit alcohol dehydrogenase family)